MADPKRAFTRREIKSEFAPKLREAIRREDYDAFRDILNVAQIVPGSERYRLLEAEFWRAVAQRRRNKHGLP
jgi:hypothetical protein